MVTFFTTAVTMNSLLPKHKSRATNKAVTICYGLSFLCSKTKPTAFVARFGGTLQPRSVLHGENSKTREKEESVVRGPVISSQLTWILYHIIVTFVNSFW